jgi:hypothetical protein
MASAMEKLNGSVKAFGGHVKNAFTSAGDAFPRTGAFFKDAFLGTGNFAGAAVSGPARGALWVAALPIRGVGSAFRKAPVFSVVGGGALAIAAGANWLHRRAENQTKAEMLDKMTNAQSNMCNPYFNSVTPDETAAMDARMAEKGLNVAPRAGAVAPGTAQA